MRAEVPGLFGDARRAARIEARLAAIGGVADARANPRTGRVLVIFAAPTPEAEDEVRGALAAESDDGGPAPPSLERAAMAVLRVAREAIQIGRGDLHAKSRRRGAEEAPPDESSTPWHLWGTDAVARALGVDARIGLSPAEAKARLKTFGPNALAGVATRTRAQILASQVFTFPVALLGAAVGVSALLGDLIEAGAIALVIGSNIAVGYAVETRAAELLDAWATLRTEWAHVRRGGKEMVVRAVDVVPGDILVLRAGEPLAADARIIAANDLSADQSTLTGESLPAHKSTEPVAEGAVVLDQSSMLFAGTSVASGEGLAIVVGTGSRTQLGALERALSSARKSTAPLERQLSQLGRKLAVLSLASSAAVAAVGLVRGRPLRAIARNAVALGCAAIPEGLPTAGTTALALASRRLLRQGIVIRRLAAAETLGAVSVICADKTGTLTENRMRVTELFLPGDGLIAVNWSPGHRPRKAELTGEDGRPPSPEHVWELARIAALNSDIELDERGEITAGSSTERALAELALGIGYPIARERSSAPRVGEERRSAYRPFMVTLHRHPALGAIALVKGAPEEVLERCRLEPRQRAAIIDENESMASRGLRVLALAWRRDGESEDGEDLDFAGLVGMTDPVREGVREGLEVLRDAGIETRMLTGDQHATALAIGEKLGIPPSAVHSRVTPEDKLGVVIALQNEGRIVAMTGDGVNDGPALKAADVGIAMGERGTDIARAVADVVLAHDDLGSIAGAVHEGRRLYDNIRRAIDYLIATNMSEVLVSVVGSFLATPPVGPVQLLWLNILTDVAPALALTLEPPDHDLMRRPPRDPRAPLLGPRDRGHLGREATAMALASLGAYGVGRLRGSPARGAATSFVSLAMSQILHTYSCRSASSEKRPWLDWALVTTAGVQIFALTSPRLRGTLVGEEFGTPDLLVALVAGSIPALRHGRFFGEPRDAIVIRHADVAKAGAPRGRDVQKNQEQLP